MGLERIACLIPAYKPSSEFVTFIKKLVTCGYQEIIVVDDGGGKEFSDVFEKARELGCVVVVHEQNKGKGRALKTGIQYYLNNYQGLGLVTADADGQHSIEDIEKVANAMMQNLNDLVMGCRVFGKEVPFKSKAGNEITKVMYKLATGVKLSDTQTGLRGIPYHSLEKMMFVKGERYEFEMGMLMELKSLELSIVEVPIQTIYIDDNSGSHFNVLRDSILVYGMIFKYIGASLFSFLLDYGLFALLLGVLPNVLADPNRLIGKFSLMVIIANVCARVVSTVVNFLLNKKILTPATAKKKTTTSLLVKYYSLAIFALLMDTILVSALGLLVGSYVAKVISAIIIYLFNFAVQKRYIFV